MSESQSKREHQARPTLPLMATIICQDCGDERKRCPKNTLYCKKCRVLREITYWRLKTRYCRGCKAKFAPLERPDFYCSKCDPGLDHLDRPCALVKVNATPHNGPPTYPQIPVCAKCMRDPKKRPHLIIALTNGRNDRRKANHKETP